LSGLNQSGTVPGAIFVSGYNLGLLVEGENNIPANFQTKIEGTNTVEGTQTTNVVGGTPPDGSETVTTTIDDPDDTRGTGDETATDASFDVDYDDLTWTAGASGTIEYRQESIAAPPPTAANNSLLINAQVGAFPVQFRCAPGTVTPPDPGVIALTDPAASFDTTDIVPPTTNDPPVADAGPDQTVASEASVTLDGTGSSDPDVGDTITHSWTQTSGPAVTLDDASSATPSFTAPVGPAVLVFEDEVCDQEPLCDTDSVTITVEAPVVQVADASMDVAVHGQTCSRVKPERPCGKRVIAKVSNVGQDAFEVCDTDVSWDIEVNGVDTTGSVSAENPGCRTVRPGRTVGFRFLWTYGPAIPPFPVRRPPCGEVKSGDIVDITATVAVAGDTNPGNDTETETRTAK